MRFSATVTVLCIAILTAACVDTTVRNEADAFLTAYESQLQQLYYEWSEADWASNTHIVEGDTTNGARTRRAREAFVRFAGSTENIDTIRTYLEMRGRLSPLQAQRLEKMLYLAAEGPQSIPDIVQQRIAEETEQVERLYGYAFTLRGRPITPNEIDGLLRTSSDLAERRRVWEASKEVGTELKPGIIKLRDLRNQTVRRRRLSPGPDGARCEPTLETSAAGDHGPGTRCPGDTRLLRSAVRLARGTEPGADTHIAGLVSRQHVIVRTCRSLECHDIPVSLVKPINQLVGDLVLSSPPVPLSRSGEGGFLIPSPPVPLSRGWRGGTPYAWLSD